MMETTHVKVMIQMLNYTKSLTEFHRTRGSSNQVKTQTEAMESKCVAACKKSNLLSADPKAKRILSSSKNISTTPYSSTKESLISGVSEC